MLNNDQRRLTFAKEQIEEKKTRKIHYLCSPNIITIRTELLNVKTEFTDSSDRRKRMIVKFDLCCEKKN